MSTDILLTNLSKLSVNLHFDLENITRNLKLKFHVYISCICLLVYICIYVFCTPGLLQEATEQFDQCDEFNIITTFDRHSILSYNHILRHTI